MPRAQNSFFLHSVGAGGSHHVIYLSAEASEKRPVHRATGYAAHPAHFSPAAPHVRKGADGYRSIDQAGGRSTISPLNQQKTRAAMQILIVSLLQESLSKYQY